MIPTVKVGPLLKELILLAIRAVQCVLLKGPTGVGKTQVIHQAADELGMECRVLNLSVHEPADITGLPYIKKGKTHFAQPNFLPDRETRGGLLFLDEINRNGREMTSVSMQLMLDRRVNAYKLPDTWRVMAACNPDNGEYHVEPIDPALACRFMEIQVVPDLKFWLEWAMANGVHPIVIEYARSTPKIFSSTMSNPRAWASVSALLAQYELGGYSKELLVPAIQSKVGIEHGLAFAKLYKNPTCALPPKPMDVIRNYSRVRSRVKALTNAGDTSVLNSLVTQVLTALQDPDLEHEVRGTRRLVNNLNSFKGALPAEFALVLDRALPWLNNRRKSP